MRKGPPFPPSFHSELAPLLDPLVLGRAGPELCLLLGRLEHLEAADEVLVDANHRSGIIKLSAVVGCREERDELPLGEELEPILDDLVRTAEKRTDKTWGQLSVKAKQQNDE